MASEEKTSAKAGRSEIEAILPVGSLQANGTPGEASGDSTMGVAPFDKEYWGTGGINISRWGAECAGELQRIHGGRGDYPNLKMHKRLPDLESNGLVCKVSQRYCRVTGERVWTWMVLPKQGELPLCPSK